jgi:hypothetical protein
MNYRNFTTEVVTRAAWLVCERNDGQHDAVEIETKQIFFGRFGSMP